MRPGSIRAFARTCVILACVAVVGCSAGASSADPASSSGPTAASSASASHSPEAVVPPVTANPSASPAASSPPTGTPVPSSKPSPVEPGGIVETLVGSVRVRSKPRVTDSVKYEPLLPSGTKLYVLAGPVEGSGYRWFWVAQLSSTKFPSGWVAAAGRDGEPWLGESDLDCPAAPDDLRSLVALPRGVGAACFSRVPITFDARLFDCNCDPTPGSDWITPNWLFPTGRGAVIVDPTAVRLSTSDSADGEGIALVRDPEGSFPARLPVGVYLERDEWTVPPVVRVTGMFDHPAAQTCRWDAHDERAEAMLPLDPAVGTCRLEFAVTRIVVP